MKERASDKLHRAASEVGRALDVVGKGPHVQVHAAVQISSAILGAAYGISLAIEELTDAIRGRQDDGK